MIDLRNLSKNYKKKKIFQNTHFKAGAGEIVLLMGKSGIGKSTLLDIIAGMTGYDSGAYFYQGQEIFPKNDTFMSGFRNKNIGYILQDFALIEDYTVLENITLPALYNLETTALRVENRARELARTFDLSEVLEQKVKNISGGQKQRVAISRSLILNPPLLLADEPTTNLDAENFSLVMETFVQLKSAGKLVIIATHDDRIKSIANKLYTFDNYKLKQA